MSTPGNPAGLPGYNAPGEEWYASTQELTTPAQPPSPRNTGYLAVSLFIAASVYYLVQALLQT